MDSKTPLEKVFRLAVSQKKALKKLGLLTVQSLLLHLPKTYGEMPNEKYIQSLSLGENVLVRGKMTKIETVKTWKKKIAMTKGVLEDATGKIRVVWFHQPYIAKMIPPGSLVSLVGKVQEDKQGMYLANPIQGTTLPPTTPRFDPLNATRGKLFSKETEPGNHDHFSFQPIYAESKGITSQWFYYAMKKIFALRLHEHVKDILPDYILKRYNLPTLKTALVWIHRPRKKDDAVAARKRFAFEEVFFIQLERIRARAIYQKNPGFQIKIIPSEIQNFISRFPFALTNAQKRAIDDIFSDFIKNKPMSRLLEGDVGSGKTAVAAITSYAVVTSRPHGQDFGNLQVAFMAPTEILAKQHFESMIEYFSHMPIQIGLITGSGCRKFPSKVNALRSTAISRTQLLRWVSNGEIPIVIGTHALIQKTVKFKHLAHVIIDEQHRFGTMQRFKLVQRKNSTEVGAPHLLSMTATPIPRTLALTVYSDLDLTLLDQMPPGRKPILTAIVPPRGRAEAYTKIREELLRGRQLYVICPRIDEPDPEKFLALNAKSVKEEARRLKEDIFPEYEIEIIHSKLRPKEKEVVMGRFLENKIQILVATSVVEVGVNIPNATVIIIEGAERFGLAQLHQLRGRVLRSTEQAYCYIFTDSKNQNTLLRLRALERAKNGFELSERDLEMRGPGELSGLKQWGISDIGMEAIKNIKMVEAARKEAHEIITSDPDLKNYPLLKERLQLSPKEIHFE